MYFKTKKANLNTNKTRDHFIFSFNNNNNQNPWTIALQSIWFVFQEP